MCAGLALLRGVARVVIVNIRGTGGSGKSTVVRAVMARYACVKPVYGERKRPLGYVCLKAAAADPLWVVGHYETPCGGGDTMPTPGAVFDLAQGAAERGCDAIFEGIISQDDVRRTTELAHMWPLLVVALDVPIETCLESIRNRRLSRGNERPLNPKNTVQRAKTLVRTMERLAAAGIEAVWASRAEALQMCCARLNLSTQAQTAIEFQLK